MKCQGCEADQGRIPAHSWCRFVSTSVTKLKIPLADDFPTYGRSFNRSPYMQHKLFSKSCEEWMVPVRLPGFNVTIVTLADTEARGLFGTSPARRLKSWGNPGGTLYDRISAHLHRGSTIQIGSLGCVLLSPIGWDFTQSMSRQRICNSVSDTTYAVWRIHPSSSKLVASKV